MKVNIDGIVYDLSKLLSITSIGFLETTHSYLGIFRNEDLTYIINVKFIDEDIKSINILTSKYFNEEGQKALFQINELLDKCEAKYGRHKVLMKYDDWDKADQYLINKCVDICKKERKRVGDAIYKIILDKWNDSKPIPNILEVVKNG